MNGDETVPGRARRLMMAALDGELGDEERGSFVGLLSRAVREGEVSLVNSLAHWSGLRQDFDLAVGLLERERDRSRRQSLLTAFRGGVALTKGREAEARSILVRVLSDPSDDAEVRAYARVLLDSHEPLDARTKEAVDLYRDEVRDR